MARQPADLEHWAQTALEPTTDPSWVLREHGYDPIRESGIESRFAIGNGFLGVRGARAASRGPTWVSWLHTLSWASWPRTFVAGLFDVPNTEPPVPALVPAPDWLRLRVSLDGEPVLLRAGELLVHSRTLDLKRGLLLAQWHHKHSTGHVMRLRTLRAASLAERNLGLQVAWLEVDGPPIEVMMEARLEVTNPVLEVVRVQPDLGLWRTSQSGKSLALTSAVGLQVAGRRLRPAGRSQLKRSWTWTTGAGQPALLWRLVSIARGDDDHPAADRVATAALSRARRSGYAGVLRAHERGWAERWAASDVQVEGDEAAQRALRFATYHLTSAANPTDERVSIGARALTGDAYLGHVFWDTEIYLLPFYTFTWPEAARALLMYRFHTLPAARAKAARLGYRGALYAWESADTGEETTPEQILAPNGQVIPVRCGTQEQHISADIAYAVWQYWQATEDEAFLLGAGAEVLLETARFWASRSVLEGDSQYHIRGVIGPDEYHEHVDDNAYTNVLARWNLERGVEVAALLGDRWPEHWLALRRRLGLDEMELTHWRNVAERLVAGFEPRRGLFEQFAGYFGLEEIDLAPYAGLTVPLDVALGREWTQRSQVIKQADVVMLLALLPAAFDRDTVLANFRFYESRCSHGSSLSRGMHAVVAARLGLLEAAERYFRATAATDLDDMTGGGAGGVRIAALGGLWQAAILGFAGLGQRADGLAFEPHLPPTWRALSFRVHWRQRRVHIRLEQAGSRLVATLEAGEPLTLYVNGGTHVLHQGRPQHLE